MKTHSGLPMNFGVPLLCGRASLQRSGLPQWALGPARSPSKDASAGAQALSRVHMVFLCGFLHRVGVRLGGGVSSAGADASVSW